MTLTFAVLAPVVLVSGFSSTTSVAFVGYPVTFALISSSVSWWLIPTWSSVAVGLWVSFSLVAFKTVTVACLVVVWPASSLTVKVIVFSPRSAVVAAPRSNTYFLRLSVSTSRFGFPIWARWFEYLVNKSRTFKFTLVSSCPSTVIRIFSPTFTVWRSGVTVNVGGCVSGLGVGVTGLLRPEVTVPPLFTTVSAVIGFSGSAPVTVTVAVPPLVIPVPITVLPS